MMNFWSTQKKKWYKGPLYDYSCKVWVQSSLKLSYWENLIISNPPFLILWKESLNSDGQQFHSYINNTNNHLSPQIIKLK